MTIMGFYERKIEKIIRDAGLTILQRRKAKHAYLFTVNGGGVTATVGTSITPGDHRSTKNFESLVCRLAREIIAQ